MGKKLSGRGRHTTLPIIGDMVLELKLGRMTALVFKSDEDGESELLIEEPIAFIRGSHERMLTGSKPGETWNPRELAPLLELIGCTVVDALAEKEGRLRITFSDELVLEVRPETGYEAWHFHYPRAGYLGREVGEPIPLIGAVGRLA